MHKLLPLLSPAVVFLTTGILSPASVSAQGRPATTQPGYSSKVEIGGGSGFSADIERNGVVVGDGGSQNVFGSYSINVVTGTPVNWQVGLELDIFTFNPSAGIFIPDTAGSFTLPLGLSWQIADRWNLAVSTKPGVYSDFKDLDLEDFNAPVLTYLTYQWTDRLVVGAALVVNGRNAGLPVIGGVGLRWQMTDRWTLSLLFPKPRVEFTPNAQWRLWFGGEFRNGAYHLADDFGTNTGNPQLNGQIMEYREIRGGLGVERRLGEHWRVTLDAGWLLNRRWDFDRVNLTYDGNGAAYGQLTVNYRF